MLRRGKITAGFGKNRKWTVLPIHPKRRREQAVAAQFTTKLLTASTKKTN
jgi:hypothetical protein